MTLEIDEGMLCPHEDKLSSHNLPPLSDTLVSCDKHSAVNEPPVAGLGLGFPRRSNLDSLIELPDEESPPHQDFDVSRLGIEAYRQTLERYDGYFDENANFVSFALDDDKSTGDWLENLKPTNIQSQDGDEMGTSTVRHGDEPLEVERLDLAGIKVKLTDLLEDGESALEALERLSSPLPEFDVESLMGSSILLESHRTIPEENMAVVEELKECCSMLMSYGECSIYTQSKEDILEHLDDKEDMSEDDSDCEPSYIMQTLPNKNWENTLFGEDSSCGQDFGTLGTGNMPPYTAL